MELDTGRFTDYKNKVIKNCANVMPNAWQIFSRMSSFGGVFRSYIEARVDCGIIASLASL